MPLKSKSPFRFKLAISSNLIFLTPGSVFVCLCFENGGTITQAKSVKICQFMTKMFFKSELKYSKRYGHVTDDVISLFLLSKKLSGKTLLRCKFLLPFVEKIDFLQPSA